MSRRGLFVAHISTLQLLHAFYVFFLWSSLSTGKGDTDISFRTKHSTVTYSQHLDQIWISSLTTAHNIKKFLWQLLMAPLIMYFLKWQSHSITLICHVDLIISGLCSLIALCLVLTFKELPNALFSYCTDTGTEIQRGYFHCLNSQLVWWFEWKWSRIGS